MIETNKDYLLLSTKSTSLLLRINEIQKVTAEYYGKKLKNLSEAISLTRTYPYNQGSSISAYPEKNPQLSLDHMKLVCSTLGKGDFFSPSLILENKESSLFDFLYESVEERKPKPIGFLPTPHGASEEIILTFKEEALHVVLKLHYLIYEEDDVIGVYTEIINQNSQDLILTKAASLQLPLVNQDYELISTYGNWAGELNVQSSPLQRGRLVLDINCGYSSNRHNPFFAIKEKNANFDYGNVFGFNLVYSSNFENSIEMDSFEDVRIQVGISSTGFHKRLKYSECFITPIAVMTYSDKGINGMSSHMHNFVNDCVIPTNFKNKERPVAYNNWEATNFKFTKGKIVSLMKEASELGAELFVLDDGWFSTRDDDKHGLGDWEVNEKKLPGGLSKLSEEAKKNHLQFGIWMEPEMINADTDTYKQHPDWVIQDKFHTPSQGRNQYVLDLRKKEVQDFIYQSVSQTLKSADISYLKWDCNRDITDEDNRDGTFFYDYTLGLYQVLDRLVKDFPNVLFENCASGGNRFDLGMLSYFPQSWMSDDTDSYQRLLIQEGGLLGYPQSVMSNHVAAKTSNQMLRYTDLDTKFDVACFGVLGYELDLDDLSKVDKTVIKNQIQYYKAHRKTLQFGSICQSEFMDPKRSKIVSASSPEETLAGLYHGIQKPNPKEEHLRILGLEDDSLYHYESRKESISLKRFGNLINVVTPTHINPEGSLIALISKYKDMSSEVDHGELSGSAFASLGPVLSQEWSGVGYDERIRFMGDFGARLYLIQKVKYDGSSSL